MALDAVFFDFDGVIVDTPTYYFKHMKEYLRERTPGISDDDISGLLGLTFSKKVEHINERYGIKIDRNHFVEATSAKVMEEMGKSLELDRGLERLLLGLRAEGVPCAIASNNSKKNIEFFLGRLGISGFFSRVIAYDDVRDWKPHPETYIVAAKALGVRPGNSVAIEDTVVGVESAKGAGMKCVAIPNKFALKHNFGIADLVIRNFRELSVKKLEGLVQ
ncbi:Phosphoglycolate phosphatase [uncultured archaeon]|nr:Phosphoglycolate phosphatase [uncultured archaeon]